MGPRRWRLLCEPDMWVMNERERTSLSSSSDRNFFLKMEAFVWPEGLEAVRAMLEENFHMLMFEREGV